MGQSTWHLTSRVTSPRCKERVVQVYCAFQYSREGKCVPPHLLAPGPRESWLQAPVWGEAAYPIRGSRPEEDMGQLLRHLETYRHASILPARIGFALLVHKDVPAIMQVR